MENKNHLKDFIAENRVAFDAYEPPKMNFEKMKTAKAKDVVKLVSLKSVLQIAAVAIVFISLVGAWGYQMLKTSPRVNVAKIDNQEVQETFKLSEVSEEMAELENYYVRQVSLKYKELEGLGVDDDVNEELKMLSEEFLALQKELGKGVDNQVILEEMVSNYQMKLDFLEQIINNMNSVKEKSPKNKKDENNYTIYY